MVNKEEIQNIITMTINELRRQGMLKDDYTVILRETEPVLKEYFKKKNNKAIEYFLIEYSDDPYIDIIYLHYRDSITIERIAECLYKDTSTIKRNKKRLIKAIHSRLD